MSGVVVWAYLNDRHQWSPYEPSVSSEIEKVFSAGAPQKVDLGAISPALSCYEVDVVNMQQIRKYTGSVRRLQRSVYPSGSPFSQGFIWEFEGDTPSHWVVYDVETLELIEGAYSGLSQPGATWLLDLQQSPLRLPYVIDFRQSTQTRMDTGKVRKIRRRALTQPYTAVPMVTISTPIGGAPAAAAQTLGTLPSSSSSSSLSSSSSSTSQGSTGTPAWHLQQGKLKSLGKRHRHQPYMAKSGSGQGSQGTNQVQGQSVVSQTGYMAPSSQQGQQQLQIQQLQQGIQQLHTPQTQIYNGPGPMTRKRLQQNPSQAMGQSLSVPTLQQQQIANALLSAVQQQQQQQQQPHSVFSLSSHNTMVVNHQPLPAPGQGLHLGFQYPAASLQQPQSIGLISSSALPPPLAHQHPQVFGTSSSSSSSSSTSNSQPPESLPAVTKITISKARKTKPKTGMEVLGRYMHHINKDLDENNCAICCDKLSEASSYGEGKPDAHDAVQLTQCGHQFHKLCLLEMYNANHKDDSVQCPSCKTIYGEKTGICPSGYMQWQVVHGLTLPGYERYGTICVTYHISPGIQGPEHPNPGERYSTRGFPRQGFIPDCDQGRKVLKLLMEAFRRRLMFTIGTSHTTGETNTVTWNEIHHKTEPHGNHSGHGYPDPKYLDNVLLELAAHGVTEDCLPFLTF